MNSPVETPTMIDALRRAGTYPLAALLLLTLALAGCASTKDAGEHRYLYQSDDNYVRLEPSEPGATANAHPFTVSADQLRGMLADLKVSGASTIGRTPVFSPEELEAIVSSLTTALSQAAPNQDVTFAVTSHRGLLGSLSPKSVTTGRMFATGDSLHLIFGLMQARVDTGKVDYTGVDPEVTPGKRARRIETVWEIEPGRGGLREQRGDWVVFDRSAVPAAAGTAKPQAREADADSAEAAPASDFDRKAQALENRLRLLNTLREKGAITDKEYRERRQAILDQL